jgi:phosphate starvation-inducible protein PhoH and related proteins
MRKLKPHTRNHHEYIKAIVENPYTLVTGPPGTSKSFTAVGMACQYLTEGKVDRIIITRPMVQTGKNPIGYLKGGLDEKVSPYMVPVLDHLDYFLGSDVLEDMRKDRLISIVPLELSRGMNFTKAFVVGDEFQNADYDQIKMFITRLCKGSKMVLNGDLKQSDIKTKDFGLVIERLKDLDGVGIVELTNEDNMRSPMIAKVLKRLEV